MDSIAAQRKWMLFIVLLAFAVRVWQLDAQSLRGDEAFDVVFTARPWAEIAHELRTTQPYPPLFYVFLKGWMSWTGQSEFALRFPSLWGGVMAVVLLYRLADLWCGRRTALWAAFLLTWQPLAIWYAQDGRMYTALMLFPLLSLYLGARLWSGERARWLWVGYGLASWIGLMTHYMSALALLSQQVCLLYGAWRRKDVKLVLRWHVVQMVVALLYVPWLIYAWPLLRSHTSSWVQPASWLQIVWRVLRAYTVGLTLDWRLALVPALAAVGAMALGTLFLWRFGRGRVLFYLLALIGVPVMSITLLSLYRPAFDERYLLFTVPPILVLAAHGLGARWDLGRVPLAAKKSLSVARLVLALFVVGGMGASFGSYRFDPAYAKSRSWHELFAYLEPRLAPGDVIIYTFPDPAPEVYVAGRWPIEILPTAAGPTWDELMDRATGIAAQYERIWLIPQWSPEWDESGMVEDVLDTVCERAAELHVDSWSLVLYHTPSLYMQEIEPVDAYFGERIRLLGYVLRDQEGAVVDRVRIAPGGSVRLSLYWQALSSIDRDYVVFVHALDETGWVRGQQDNQPRQGTLPTRAWSTGDVIVDSYRVPVAAEAPSGSYAIELGLYRPADVVRLPASGTDVDAEGRRVLIEGRVWVKEDDRWSN